MVYCQNEVRIVTGREKVQIVFWVLTEEWFLSCKVSFVKKKHLWTFSPVLKQLDKYLQYKLKMLYKNTNVSKLPNNIYALCRYVNIFSWCNLIAWFITLMRSKLRLDSSHEVKWNSSWCFTMLSLSYYFIKWILSICKIVADRLWRYTIAIHEFTGAVGVCGSVCSIPNPQEIFA